MSIKLVKEGSIQVKADKCTHMQWIRTQKAIKHGNDDDEMKKRVCVHETRVHVEQPKRVGGKYPKRGMTDVGAMVQRNAF